MSKPTKNPAKYDERVTQFCNVTGASAKDATKYLSNYNYRVDAAVDAFYNEGGVASSTPAAARSSDPASSAARLATLFEKYKDKNGDDITIDGTIKLCEDLDVGLEDVVLLAIAFELKSPGVGEWTKKGWMEGWKSLGCDSIATMKATLPRISKKLSSDSKYFQSVYNYTFDFAKTEGQRSVSIETAQAFWSLLLPHGLRGGALSHTTLDGTSQGGGGGGGNNDDEDEQGDSQMADTAAGAGEGWKPEHMELWFEYLNEKGGKGVSKDTWTMFFDFVRTIDSKFEKHDFEAAWPSTIDDFAAWAKEKVASS